MSIVQRTSLHAIPAYKQGATPGAGQQAFKLSSNENPYPPLDSVTGGLAAELGAINQYPNAAAPQLVGALAARLGVEPDTIALGAGSVEVAGQLIHATANPGDEVVFAWRSFEAYPILTHVAGATPVAVPLDARGAHDLPAMAEAITERTALVFICNPNNPTGTVVDTAAVDAFMAKVPARVLVVIDEAYVHFNTEPGSAIGLDFFRRYPNVAVLHTFSKAYGLAGLRIGYAVAPPEVAANLRKTAVPFGVTALAQRAAVLSLEHEGELQVRIDNLVAARETLLATLRDAGINATDSQANFIWISTGEDTGAVDAALRASGIWARAFPGEGIRISIGSAEANETIATALISALQEAPAHV
ncbi:histidinol-phosphate transaminase [Arthrobacter sp. UCD-GKA]|uniref:histidinol-phosphate transaminase n=1 Tax=Arthrobacter sp. UCD-GKA TaxID=1913576 RepID=UPI0008DE21A2|nr:histidinol-phosphate transaminase [Arthrobacter sp. UCD-GKA]OIH84441.1 histidinol-phosphate transaminase [Arthrobacter sp. UCD-GKA]